MERFIEFEVLHCTGKKACHLRDIAILLNLEGTFTAEGAGRRVCLQQNDLLLFNSRTPFTVEGTDALCVLFQISVRKLAELFPGKKYVFACDSTAEVNDNYEILRRYLSELLLISYEAGEYRAAEEYKTGCELLLFLVNNFASMHYPVGHDDRMDSVTDFINENYREELSLKLISAHFHMTPQYFSKYFKQHMNINYHDYLARVRLEAAVEDLQYTNKSLLLIALDNGFANAESFHRYFEKAYGQSPLAYREERNRNLQEKKKEREDALARAVAQLADTQKQETVDMLLQIDAQQKQRYLPFWREMLNLDSCDMMNDFEARRQFTFLQGALEFHYIRLAPDWRGFQKKAVYSFFSEEKIFDFFMENKMRLWLVIPLRAVTDEELLIGYLRGLLAHFSNRYTIDEVRTWRFELSYDTQFDERKLMRYWAVYDRVRAVLHSFHIEEGLLGAGISLGNAQAMDAFTQYNRKHGRSMPRQTIEVEPYIFTQTQEGLQMQRTTDSSYIKNQLLNLRKRIPLFDQDTQELFLTSRADSILKINVLNDHSYRGAAIIKNIIDCFGMVSAMAHSTPLDLAYTQYRQDRVLFGGDGLLSKHGLRKASFYAYSFMKNVGAYFYGKNKQAMIFGNGDRGFQIICHNCRRLGYHYYLDEGNLRLEKLEQYFDDHKKLTLEFHLTGLKNGVYSVRFHRVSPTVGSLLDELHKLAPYEGIFVPDYLEQDDVDYLEHICVPGIMLRSYPVSDGKLHIQTTLEANEFQYIDISYTYARI